MDEVDYLLTITMTVLLPIVMVFGWGYSQADFAFLLTVSAAFLSSSLWVLASVIPLYLPHARRSPALINSGAALFALTAAMASVNYPTAYKPPAWITQASFSR